MEPAFEMTSYEILRILVRKLLHLILFSLGLSRRQRRGGKGRLEAATEASMLVNNAADALADEGLCQAYLRKGDAGTREEVIGSSARAFGD